MKNLAAIFIITVLPAIVCTAAVSFIPSMIGRIMDNYNNGNPSPVTLGISGEGIGLTLKIR